MLEFCIGFVVLIIMTFGLTYCVQHIVLLMKETVCRMSVVNNVTNAIEIIASGGKCDDKSISVFYAPYPEPECISRSDLNQKPAQWTIEHFKKITLSHNSCQTSYSVSSGIALLN